MSASSPQSMPQRTAPVGYLAAAIALLLLLALPTLWYPLARDHGVFGVIAGRILGGGLPFVDAWDFKPPAIYYLFAAALAAFGQTSQAIRALDLLFFPFAAVGIYILAWRACDQPADPHHQMRDDRRLTAVLAVVLYGVFYFSESFWALAQNDGLAIPFMIWAFVLVWRATDASTARNGALWLMAAGALLGVAFWFKYTFVLLLPALWWLSMTAGASNPTAALHARDVRALAWRTVRFGAAVGAGLALVIGGYGVVLHSQGILDDLIQSAQLVAPYAGLGYDGLAWYQTPVWLAGVAERWALWWPLLVGLSITTLILARTPFFRRVHPFFYVALAWAALMLLNVLWQAKGISYQWLPILPPLVLMFTLTALPCVSTLAAGRAIERPLLVVGGLIAAVVLLLRLWWPILPYWAGTQTQAQYYARFRGGEFVADESLAMADYLRARVAAGDTLYIWGFRPEVYYLSGLRPATRFISQFPLTVTWYPQAWQQENVDTLWAAMPPYVLVVRGDDMPWVTGVSADSNVLLQSYTELNNWLIANYDYVEDVGNFIVYRRR
jgi:4-amino-4-deoxy-L-arabinose transferase-like glycosyltransferase